MNYTMNEGGSAPEAPVGKDRETDGCPERMARLAERIKAWGTDLGFQQIGISDIDLQAHERRLERWLQDGFHGSMSYMARHGRRRSRPAALVPGTVRVISGRMDYLREDARPARDLLDQSDKALISRYALGRDYHKVLRRRLQNLADRCD